MKSGYSNPYSKLCTCFGGGRDGPVKVMTAYWNAYEATRVRKNGKDIRACLNCAAGCLAKINALNDWITMIVVKNWPVTSIKDNEYQALLKHTFKISCKRICKMLFLMGKVIEEKIADQLKDKHTMAIYDGLTLCGTHYVVVYVSYILNGGTSEERLEINLLGCSLMPAAGAKEELINNLGCAGDIDAKPHYAAKFNAETMFNFLSNLLEQYG